MMMYAAWLLLRVAEESDKFSGELSEAWPLPRRGVAECVAFPRWNRVMYPYFESLDNPAI